MKFISKNSNYSVVLKHGQPAEPLTGRIAVNGLYVKFVNGVANVINEEIIKLMLNHPSYNRDFISVEEDKGTADPWADTRADAEPEHDILNLEHGSIVKNVNPRPKITLPRDKQKILKEMAKEMAVDMAREMAPRLAKELLDKIMLDAKQEKSSTAPAPEVDKTTGDSQ